MQARIMDGREARYVILSLLPGRRFSSALRDVFSRENGVSSCRREEDIHCDGPVLSRQQGRARICPQISSLLTDVYLCFNSALVSRLL